MRNISKELAARLLFRERGLENSSETDIKSLIAYCEATAQAHREGKSQTERIRAGIAAQNAVCIAAGHPEDVVDVEEYLQHREASAQ